MKRMLGFSLVMCFILALSSCFLMLGDEDGRRGSNNRNPGGNNNKPQKLLSEFSVDFSSSVWIMASNTIMAGTYDRSFFNVSATNEKNLRSIDLTSQATITVNGKELKVGDEFVVEAKEKYEIKATLTYSEDGQSYSDSKEYTGHKIYDILSADTNSENNKLFKNLLFPANDLSIKVIVSNDGKYETFYGDNTKDISVFYKNGSDWGLLNDGLGNLKIAGDEVTIRVFGKSKVSSADSTEDYIDCTWKTQDLTTDNIRFCIVNNKYKFSSVKAGSKVTKSDLGKDVRMEFLSGEHANSNCGLMTIIDEAGNFIDNLKIEIYEQNDFSGSPVVTFTSEDDSTEWTVDQNEKKAYWAKVTINNVYSNAVTSPSGNAIATNKIRVTD